MTAEQNEEPQQDPKVSRRQPSDGHLKDDEPDDEAGKEAKPSHGQ